MNENTENQEPTSGTENSTPSWSFVDPEEVAAAQNLESQPPQTETPPSTTETPPTEEKTEQTPIVETTESVVNEENVSDTISLNDIGEGNLDSDILKYLGEKLGTEVTSFDDILHQSNNETKAAGDERVDAIAKFVAETGRDPQDWFVYQQLNTSEMDDFTAVSVKMASDYPNLSKDELNTLMNDKYKLDADRYTEDEIKISQLKLKTDSVNAKRDIESMREKYAAPEVSEETNENVSPINDEWISSMKTNLDALEGVEFDLGDGEMFTFGITDSYRSELAEKNTRLDEYFDPYVQKDGTWDYDKLNMHRTVIDNIEMILQSVYKQGQGAGQRAIVDSAANVSSSSPNQSNAPQKTSLSEQLATALGGGDVMTFKT